MGRFPSVGVHHSSDGATILAACPYGIYDLARGHREIKR
jgi:hypothetical protein